MKKIAVHHFKKAILTTIISVFFLNANAWWGATGHRVTGEIADRYLAKKARKAIREILGGESVAMSSNWADFIKSDTSYRYLSPWHYINTQSGLSRDEFMNRLAADSGVNLYNKTKFLISELKGNRQLDAATKKRYLLLLIHFVGDLHQPMHVGGRRNDLGGNRVKVLWFNQPTNLHSVWDDELIDHQKLSYTEYANAVDHTSREQRRQLQSQPIEEWFYESYQAAQDIYSGITQPDQKLSWDYNFKYLAMANDRLLKGGIRLAGVLNEIFN